MKKFIMNLWPDWNSIDSVKAWHTFFEISGIVVLALLVIAEVFAFGFGKRLEALTHQIESARVAADEKKYQDAEQRHATEIGSVRETLTEAEKKVQELERLRSPRHLTDTQKNALALSLKGEQPAKIKIIPFVSAPDASEYAAEFGAIFRAAGWEVEIDNALFLDGDKTGMWLTVKDEQIPAVAQIVYNALIAAGIPMRDGAYGDGNVPAGDVWLKIGLIK